MAIYRENLQHAKKLPKKAYDKGTKPRNYTPGKKIWLKSKYFKT